MGDLDAQNLEILVEADGDPVRLSGPPLDLVYLALGGRVREDGVLDGPRHLLNVPNQGLVVVTCRKNALCTMAEILAHGASKQPVLSSCSVAQGQWLHQTIACTGWSGW